MYITGNHDRGWQESQIEISILGVETAWPYRRLL